MADILLDTKLDQVLVTARTLTQLFTFFHLAVELLWGVDALVGSYRTASLLKKSALCQELIFYVAV